jgi:uncharacterized ParB-like nuclease family protein
VKVVQSAAMIPLDRLVSTGTDSSIAVAQLVTMMRCGYMPPPIVVSRRSDGRLQVLDGCHRTEAYRRLGRSEIAAVVVVQ